MYPEAWERDYTSRRCVDVSEKFLGSAALRDTKRRGAQPRFLTSPIKAINFDSKKGLPEVFLRSRAIIYYILHFISIIYYNKVLK